LLAVSDSAGVSVVTMNHAKVGNWPIARLQKNCRDNEHGQSVNG
jgi:hypothetical protein